MLTPLDQLAERYGPEGQGARKPCPGCGLQCDCVPGTDYHCTSHHRCNGTDTALDATHPLFQALWTQNDSPGASHQICLQSGECIAESDHYCDGTGYLRRSREEAWYRLPEVLEKMDYAYGMTDLAITLWTKQGETPTTVPREANEHPLDTLARAILEHEQALDTAKG